MEMHRILKTQSMGAAVVRGVEGGDDVDLDPPLLQAALAGKALFPGTCLMTLMAERREDHRGRGGDHH